MPIELLAVEPTDGALCSAWIIIRDRTFTFGLASVSVGVDENSLLVSFPIHLDYTN